MNSHEHINVETPHLRIYKNVEEYRIPEIRWHLIFISGDNPREREGLESLKAAQE